jgi:hypothetical protein
MDAMSWWDSLWMSMCDPAPHNSSADVRTGIFSELPSSMLVSTKLLKCGGSDLYFGEQVTLLEHNHCHALKTSQSILRDCVRWALALFRLGEPPQFYHLNPFFVQRLSKVLFCCMLRLPSAQQQQRAAKAAMYAPMTPSTMAHSLLHLSCKAFRLISCVIASGDSQQHPHGYGDPFISADT